MVIEKVVGIVSIIMILLSIGVSTGYLLARVDRVEENLKSKVNTEVYGQHEQYYEKSFDAVTAHVATVEEQLSTITQRTVRVETKVESIAQMLENVSKQIETLCNSRTIVKYFNESGED